MTTKLFSICHRNTALSIAPRMTNLAKCEVPKAKAGRAIDKDEYHPTHDGEAPRRTFPDQIACPWESQIQEEVRLQRLRSCPQRAIHLSNT